MTFEQALEAMKNGKRVKHKSWVNTWIWLDFKNEKCVILKHEKVKISSIYADIPVEWLMLDGWEVIGSD